SVRTRGPARIRRAGVWVNRYIRT
ncbi:hypothetical protein ACU79_10050, partial [Escherichia coli]